MKVYTNAKLIASGRKEFDDKEGNPVKYFENILKDTEGNVATINSQADYSSCEGQAGVAEFRIRDTGKLSLISFTVGEGFELPEKEIS